MLTKSNVTFTHSPFFMVSGKVSCYGKLWTPPRKRLNVSYFYLSGRPGDNMTLSFKDNLN